MKTQNIYCSKVDQMCTREDDLNIGIHSSFGMGIEKGEVEGGRRI